MNWVSIKPNFKASLLVALPALMYLSLCVVSILAGDWKPLVRIALDQTYGDLRMITSYSECLLKPEIGRMSLACDPWGRDFNYPKVWLDLAYFFQVTSIDTNFLGVSLIFMLLIAFLVLSFNLKYCVMSSLFSEKTDTLIRVIIVCSPPSFFLAERGNVEIIIFLLLVTIAFLPLRFFWTTVVIWILASNLKIYPIIAAIFMLHNLEKLRKVILALTLGGLVFSTFTARQLQDISAASDYFSFDSFGAQIFTRMFCYPQEITKLYCTPPVQAISGLITILAVWIVIQLFAKVLFKELMNSFHNTLSGSRVGNKVLLTFGSTFALTFVIGTNWDYRLVLLYPLALLVLNSTSKPKEIKQVLILFIAPLYLSYNEWVPLQILGDVVLIVLFLLITSSVIREIKELVFIYRVKS